MKPTKEGAALLRRVIKRIEEEPKRLEMATWINHVDGEFAPPCGTVACIAGWTVLDGLTDAQIKRKKSPISTQAQTALARKAERLIMGTVAPKDSGVWAVVVGPLASLFYSIYWPEPFKRAYYTKPVEATIARIRHFIKTGE